MLLLGRDAYVMSGDDPNYHRIAEGWGDALKSAFAALPPLGLTLTAPDEEHRPR